MSYFAFAEVIEPGPRSGARPYIQPAVYPYPAFVQETSGIGDTIFRYPVGVFSTYKDAWKAAEEAAWRWICGEK